jgi:ACS family hexuronate transporter-like MFS transporter
VSSPVQKVFGRIVDETKSFDTGLAWAGIAPFVALIALIVAWPRESGSGGDSHEVKPN